MQGDLSFIPFEALSGTEQVIATIAVQAGLSAAAGGIVMVDEFSRIDEKNKALLAEELFTMVEAGTLAQVIIVDHAPDFAKFARILGAHIVAV